MKKTLAIVLALTMALLVLAGCANNNDVADNSSVAPESSSEASSEAPEVSFEDIKAKLKELVPAAMSFSMEMTDEEVSNLYHFNVADVEEYYIDVSGANVQADNIIAIKAKDETKVEDIKAGLEQRRADVEKSFEQYLVNKYELAKNGKVFAHGNYVFLIIHENADAAVEAIDEMFK